MSARARARLGAALGLACCSPSALRAQTDYYNTDAGRPVRIEDAYAVERRALELQLAPLRVERPRGSGYRWGLEPEIALGVLPRTQLEIGLPMVHVEGVGGRRRTAVGGIDVSALYTLNAETRLPALAIAAGAVFPIGGAAPRRTVPTITALATRTLPWLRIHANAQLTLADRDAAAPRLTAAPTGTAEFTKWMAGVAIDHTFPLRALLLTAEVLTSAPLATAGPQRWDTAAGARYQLSPRVAVDGGVGYRLRGDDQGWFVTSGAAVAVGLPLGRSR